MSHSVTSDTEQERTLGLQLRRALEKEVQSGFDRLLCGDHQPLHIKSFFDTEPIKGKIDNIKNALKSTESESEIYKTQDVPLFNAVADRMSGQRLLDMGLNREVRCDSEFFPYISPISYWWRLMDALWPPGLVRLRWKGRRLPFGLTRQWAKGSYALPHQDVLRRELPNDPVARRLKRQFGLNLYLDTGIGGELEAWDCSLSDDMVKRLNVAGSYGFDRGLLGAPNWVLKPSPGDAIVLDTECVHSVLPVREGDRVTQSAFIGFIDHQSPLVCWS